MTGLRLPAQVRGIVADSTTKKPVESAVISLYTGNGGDTLYTLSNERGEFIFEKTPAINFTVDATSTGYRPWHRFRRIYGTEKNIDLGTIFIANAALILEEIKIHSAPITVKEDTIEYKGDAFKVKENAVVEDLLKKLPGVQVDKNGNIKAQGKPITKVKVNGKDFFAGDPKTATRELPANIVDKIQVIDDYGDQATVSGIKDSDPEKIMNIQLKKDKNTGQFGRVSGGAGSRERYQASLNFNYFKDATQISVITSSNNTGQASYGGPAGGKGGPDNGVAGSDMPALPGSAAADAITTSHSFGLNYRNQWGKKMIVFGSYTYSRKKSVGNRIMQQQNIFPGKTYINNQESDFTNLTGTHRFALNIEYTIDSFNYIKISPAFSYGTNDVKNYTSFDYSTLTAKTSEGDYASTSESQTPNLNGMILFNHRFRKRGRNLSFNLTLGNSNARSNLESKSNTVLYNPAGGTSLHLYNNQENENNSCGTRITYTEPLSKIHFMDLTWSHNLSHTGNNKSVFDIDPVTGLRSFNSGLSNEYENVFRTDRFNLNLRAMEKKYNYSLGLSVQPVTLQGESVSRDSTYRAIKRVNIFPVARVAFNFSRTRSFTASYRGDARQPSYNQLQDVVDSSNLQYRTQGNPSLKPSILHNLNFLYNNFNFTRGTVLFSSLSLSTIQHNIVSNTTRIGSSGAQITRPENVNGYVNISGFYTLSQPFRKRRYIVTLNGNLNFTNTASLIDNQKNNARNWIIGQGINVEFNHKDWLQAGLGIMYNTNLLSYGHSSGLSLANNSFSSIAVTHTFSADLPGDISASYDLEYQVNKGLPGALSRNPVAVNLSVEKRLFEKKNATVRFQVYDLLDENTSFSRTINGNSIIDSRSSRLTRYIMLSFSYKFQKFAGSSHN